MRILNQNTLYDIARHSDKTLKMADFMIKSKQPFLFHEMVKIDNNSNAIEAIEAYHKDIQKTVSHFEKVHQLLSTVDENNNVQHLKNKEKNLKNIFGDNYDENYKTIDFGSCELDLRREFDKDSFTRQIIENTVHMKYEKYLSMYKGRKTIFKLSDKLLNTAEERISFLSVVKEQEEYREGIEAIRQYGQEFSNYRAKMPLESKNKIDNEITFNRSMIDSVTKQSTYLTKEKGIEQISTPHKKEKTMLNKLLETLKKSKVVTAIELDADSSIEAVENVIKQMEDIEFNLANEIVFKARKLGNYNANGLYLDSQKIVSVDIKNPSAAIHECIHAVDIGNEDLYYSQQRKDIVRKFSKHINIESIPENKLDYYLNDKEIIARLGEVSYLLNKYDYKETETIEEFERRVELLEKNENPYELNLSKPIKQYTRQMANIYFNLSSIPKEDLMEAKEFYQSYFGVEGQKIRKINTIKVEHENARETKRAKVKRYQIEPVSLFNKDNIEYALNYNKEHKLIEMDLLIKELIQNCTKVARKVKQYNNSTFANQKEVFNKIADWLSTENDNYLTYKTMESIAEIYPLIDTHKALLHKEVIGNNYQVSLSEFKAPYIELIEKANKELEELSKDLSVNDPDYYTKNHKRYEKTQDIKRLESRYIRDYNNFIESKIPEYISNIELTREAFAVEKRKDGTTNKSLVSSAQRRMFEKIVEVIREKIDHEGIENIFIHSSKNDYSPYLVLGDDAFKRTFFANNTQLQTKFNDLMGIYLANDILTNAVLNKNSFIERPKRGYDEKGNVTFEGEKIKSLDLFKTMGPVIIKKIEEGELKPSELMAVYPDYSSEYISKNMIAKSKNNPVELFKLKTIKEVPEIDFEADIKEEQQEVLSFLNKKKEEEIPKIKESKKPVLKGGKGSQMKLF